MQSRDVELPPGSPSRLLTDQHVSFLQAFARNKDSLEQVMAEYLKMSGIYWSLVAVQMVHRPSDALGQLSLLSCLAASCTLYHCTTTSSFALYL